MPSYQYLESLDSLRLRHDFQPDALDRGRLQVFSDVLMSLALGRDVVVPQSFALDSFGFLEVARTVLSARSARSTLDSMPRPFRLHLYGVESYRDAVVAMLERVDRPDEPFVSSLLPGLVREPGRATAVAREIGATARIDPLITWAETSGYPQVAEGLEAMWKEFGTATVKPGSADARVVRPAQRGAVPSLRHAVEELLQPSSRVRTRLAERGVLDHGGAKRTLDALATLRETARGSGADPFRNRSALYSDAPWPGSRRTARRLVGDDDLALARECVSTLYNMTVADSIGVAPAHFSTPVAGATGDVRALGLAQELALGFIDAPVVAGLGSTGFGPTAPTGEARSPEGGADVMSALRAKAAEAFEVVLAAREDPEFAKSARALATAASDRTPGAVDRATDRHARLLEARFRHVAQIDKVETSDGSALRIGLAVGALDVGAGAAAVGASMVQDWPWVVEAGLGAAGILGSVAMFSLTVREVRQRRAHKREGIALHEHRVDELSAAIGRVVAMPGIAQHPGPDPRS